MYNRYVRNDHGHYSRVPPENAAGMPPPPKHEDPPKPPTQELPPSQVTEHHRSPKERPKELRWVERLLKKIHLEDIDAGDLLLLLLLFLLFREEGDEEILIAIGLLLIM